MASTDIEVDRPGVGPSSYWGPRHFVPSAWREHAPFASWLMSVARPRTVVELGTHNGYSAFVLAEAAKRLHLETRIHAIDSWEGDDQAGFYGEDVYDSVRRIVDAEYADLIEPVRAYFADAATRFDDGSIDLLHIDGRHGYEDVKEDYETYRPKLSPRAVVIFHDVHEFQPTFGVHRFWDELAPTAPSFAFHHGHGLGVLAVGPEAPAPVLEFLAAANADPDELRGVYSRLGAAISEQFAVRDRAEALAAENANLIRELDTYGRALEDALRHIDAIHTSPAWRASAPLRAVRRRLRRSA